MKNAIEFIVINDGDTSVGIRPSEFTVSVSSFDGFEEEFIEEFIEEFKKDLEKHFSFETKCKVYTKEEFENFLDEEFIIAEHMAQMQLHNE